MFAIHEKTISVSWSTKDLLTTCENKSHIYSSYIPEENFESSLLTSYDDLFFNMELSNSLKKLFQTFAKFCIVVENSLYINKKESDGDKISGFEIKSTIDSDKNPLYNYTTIEVIDYLSTQYIIESIIGAWAGSKKLKEMELKSSESSAQLLGEISNQIIHLKRPNYSQSYTIN